MQISKLLYKYTPKKVRRMAGNSILLKPFRDLLLRSKGSYKEINEDPEIIPFMEALNYTIFNDDLLPYYSKQSLPQNAYFVYNP